MVIQARNFRTISSQPGIISRRTNHLAASVIMLILFMLLLDSRCPAQTVASPYQVGTWQGFRSGAVSYTFDDNCPNQLSIAVPMFDEFGFKLTLFTVTSSSFTWQADWGKLQKAASEGHEIASHTVDHLSFSGMIDSLQKSELELSRDTIEARITGQKCTTIAYPYCVGGKIALVTQYYIAARGCSGQVESKTPSNFMNISSIILGDQGSNTVAAIKSRANTAASTKGWCVFLIHGINGTEPGAYSPISQDTLRATLEYLNANPGKFWVTAFGTVARYIIERNSASVSEISNNSDSITVQLTDNLDNVYYNIPLTVRRPLPDGWDSAIVQQNGEAVPSQIVNADTIQFDAVPDAGTVKIINTSVPQAVSQSGSPSHLTFKLLQNYPNPFNPSSTISYQLPATSQVILKVFDVLGREVETLVNEHQSAGSHSLRFNAANLPSGVYFYKLQAGNYSDTKKLLLFK